MHAAPPCISQDVNRSLSEPNRLGHSSGQVYCTVILCWCPPLGGASKGHGESGKAIQAAPRVVGRTTFESPCPHPPSLLDISINDNVYYLYPYQGGMGSSKLRKQG